MQQKGKDRTGKAQHEALIHKGPADKAVGRAHHFHNGDLIPPVKGGELDGVGNNEHGHHKQHCDQRQADDCGDIPDCDEAVGQLRIGVDAADAGNGLDEFHRLALEFQLLDLDGEPVPEDVGVQILKIFLIRVFADEGLHGLLTGDKGDGRHIVHRFQFLLQGLGLCLRIAVIHKC